MEETKGTTQLAGGEGVRRGRVPFQGTRKCTTLYLNTSAGMIRASSAAVMIDCQEFVEFGITNPKSKFHSGGSECNRKERRG